MANTFKNKKVDLTSTSATTLYTVPTATTAVIKSILVSEDSGNADTITVTITDTDSAVFSLFKTKAISANATTELLSAPIVAQRAKLLRSQQLLQIGYMWCFQHLKLSLEKLQHRLDLLR